MFFQTFSPYFNYSYLFALIYYVDIGSFGYIYSSFCSFFSPLSLLLLETTAGAPLVVQSTVPRTESGSADDLFMYVLLNYGYTVRRDYLMAAESRFYLLALFCLLQTKIRPTMTTKPTTSITIQIIYVLFPLSSSSSLSIIYFIYTTKLTLV